MEARRSASWFADDGAPPGEGSLGEGWFGDEGDPGPSEPPEWFADEPGPAPQATPATATASTSAARPTRARAERRGVGGFEGWLRDRLRQGGGSGRRGGDGYDDGPPSGGATDPGGVTLSTVHRVKGLEWPHVVVWDASDGVMPHRLNQVGRFLEEERRIFHVAITRARSSAVVLSRAGSPSTFLDELTGEAPHRPPEPEPEAQRPTLLQDKHRSSSSGRAGGRSAPGEPLSPEASKRSDALREWRRNRSKADGVPAYVVINDKHLDGIARRAPRTLDELARCDGIGPTKLDRYGDEILATIQDL